MNLRLNYDTVAEGLLRLTDWFGNTAIWDCGMAFTIGPVFEEAYAIRATILAGQVLKIGKARGVAHSFCDRVLSTQGAVEDNMYYMGYGNQRDKKGVPNCSCVADASSSAQTIVKTIKAFPDSARNEAYVKSLRAFADYVLERYATKHGVIGVGILGHRVNPMPEYWCANALFTPALIGLGEITGETRYLDAAVAPLEFLARFDYRNTADKQWERSATEMIFYSSEGILEGLASAKMKSRLNKSLKGFELAVPVAAGANPDHGQALNRIKSVREDKAGRRQGAGAIRSRLEDRWNEYAAWLHRNQDFDGTWPDAKDYRCYQPGLAATMLMAVRDLRANPFLLSSVNRQLSGLNTPAVRRYLRLYSEAFGTAMAHLSFAYAGAACQSEDPDRFEAAVRQAQQRLGGQWW